jgi:hypothetical protein
MSTYVPKFKVGDFVQWKLGGRRGPEEVLDSVEIFLIVDVQLGSYRFSIVKGYLNGRSMFTGGQALAVSWSVKFGDDRWELSGKRIGFRYS